MIDNNPPDIPKRHRPRGVEILYEDRDIIVAAKEAGVLTVGTGERDEKTAYSALVDYVRKGQAKSRKRIFIVHRLDKGTSGVLVFAKTEEAKRTLQDNWDETRKIYWAVVEGSPERDSGTISSYLVENASTLLVRSTDDRKKGKLARTHYRVLRRMPRTSLLEVSLLTGRKHQIRVHLADEGWPVLGDTKYGRATGGRSKIALHAKRIELTHPHSGKRMAFEAPLPPFFREWGDAPKSETKNAENA